MVLLLDGRVGLRNIGVTYIFTSEFDDMPRRRGVVKVDFCRKVLDSGAVVEFVKVFRVLVFLRRVVAHPHPIVSERHCGVGEQSSVEDVVPSCRGEQVAPPDVGFVIELGIILDSVYDDIAFIVFVVEDVPSVIRVEEQPVLVAEFMGHLAVEVEEIIVRRDVRCPEYTVEQECVHPSGAD